MELILAIALLALVAGVVTMPLRRAAGEAPRADDEALADLEERKRVRYREIRDVEADHAAGKIGDADFERLDAELRADAIAILKRIDRLTGARRGKGPVSDG